MNGKRQSLWDEIQAALRETSERFEPDGPEQAGLEVSPADRKWIASLVDRQRGAQLVTLAPQAELREALRTRQTAELEATWSRLGEPARFPVLLEPDQDTADAWVLRSSAWPGDWRPFYLLAGRLELASFEAQSWEFELGNRGQEAGPTVPLRDPERGAERVPLHPAAPALNVAAADDDEIVPLGLAGESHRRGESPPGRPPDEMWQPDGHVVFETQLPGGQQQGGWDQGFALVELKSLDSPEPAVVEQLVMRLAREKDRPGWIGRARLRARAEVRADRVRLDIRPLTADDVWLLSARSLGEPTQVTEFLAGQDYTVAPLKRVDGGFRFDLSADDLPEGALADQSLTWCLQAGPAGTEVGDE